MNVGVGDLPSPKRATKTAARSSQAIFEVYQDGRGDSDTDSMQIDDLQCQSPQNESLSHGSLSPSNRHLRTQARTASDATSKERPTVSPRTPRHRDALSKRNPTTPRHQVRLGGAPLTPRTPRTPHHAHAPATRSQQIYQRAKQCFFDSATDQQEARQIIGRTNERDELQSFLSSRIANGEGGALYVSGPPGTGKSALIGEVTRRLTFPHNVKHVYLNCMALESAQDVYSGLLYELQLPGRLFEDGPKESLTKALLKRQDDQAFVVILDEIDALLNLDVNVLYNVFEWALHPSSSLILVGIANALDLTDRFLPNLRARGSKPQLLPFLPYSHEDISVVLTSRLRMLLSKDASVEKSFTPVLMPTAIQLISKKVAAQTGDLRKAFDLAVKAIRVIEAETKEKQQQQQQQQQQQPPSSPYSSPSKTPLGENSNLSQPRSNSSTPTKTTQQELSGLHRYDAENAPRASVSHIVRIASAAFNNGTKDRLNSLNLQQKAVLCSLHALEQRNQRVQHLDANSSDLLSQPRTGLLPSPTTTPSKKRVGMTPDTPTKRGNTSAPKVREVFDAYATLCTRENTLSALSYSEFRDVVCNLETMGVLTAVDGKSGSFVQIATPTRKRRGAGAGSSLARMEERRIHGIARVEELRASLDTAGAAKSMLMRMLEGRDF
ncbi:MAG: hypothetical protein Q9162_003933 [Coniocarpon cinnabarinum]